MTEERLVLAELLEKAGESDFLRAVAEAVLQLLMETDVEGLIGAGRYERSGERTTWRNGYRDRTLDTRLGALQLRIPKLRQGSYFPPFLEARKSSEKALIAVIQEAWIGGVSTRRVDDLVQAMGLSGISKSQVSKLCKEIDERVHAFLDRPLAGEWPYLWLDATYLKQREGGRIVSVAAIIAVAANTDGRREIVGLHVCDPLSRFENFRIERRRENIIDKRILGREPPNRSHRCGINATVLQVEIVANVDPYHPRSAANARARRYRRHGQSRGPTLSSCQVRRRTRQA